MNTFRGVKQGGGETGRLGPVNAFWLSSRVCTYVEGLKDGEEASSVDESANPPFFVTASSLSSVGRKEGSIQGSVSG